MLSGFVYPSYELEQHRIIDELQGEGYVLRHKKTGARVVLIDNDDKNKVFAIGFRTPPEDDTGVAHILEHSVLCGSRKFPSKDPFIELAKGSLNTFLNAMTYSDKTVYPIASCNDTDFHNLMHVYLDAVFYPNIYTTDEILKQEGWHYEIDSMDGELSFNGVVYNEMKGALSSADAMLERKIEAALLCDTPYAYESGGDPDAIPQLTKEKFLAFHTRYYHPSNSYIYLYGKVDFEKELDFLDREYLSHFEKRKIDSEIALQTPFSEPRLVEDTYSVSEDGEDGIYLSYNTAFGKSVDIKANMALQLLDYVLFSMPGAPVKKKLIDAGIGKDVETSFDAGIQQPIFSVVARNVEKDLEKRFLRVLEDALLAEVNQGINKKVLYSAINNFEFKYREADFGRYPKGLIYGLNFFNTWLYDDTKALALSNSLELLSDLKKEVESGYFEQLILDVFIKNKHKAYVNLYPEQGKNEKMEQVLKKQLAAVKNTLNRKQLYYLVNDTKKLKEFQEAPSRPEDVAKIPSLELSDIERDVLPFKNEETVIGGLPTVIHDYDTNGIVYMDLCFDVSELPLELVPYQTLLVELFRYIDTENYSYNDLATEINLKIGGMSFSTGIFPLLWKKGGFRPYFNCRLKCLEHQIKDGMNLLEEVVFSSKLQDKKRLKETISELCIRMEERIPSSGHVYAANKALSYIDPMMAYKEAAEGIEFYDLMKNIDKNFDDCYETVAENLKLACECIFRKENVTVSLTGSFPYQELLDEELKAFSEKMYKNACVKSVPVFRLQKKNEAFKTASKVSYVASAGYFEQDGVGYQGALKVLKTILSYDYLWVNVRVSGGAYGAMCGFSRNGYGYFTSYRDPNLGGTLEVYEKAWEYVKDFEVSDRDMKKYIIGTISSMDQPVEASGLGRRSFHAYQSGLTIEMVKKEREQVLNTDQEAIRALAPMIKAMIDDHAICVIGNNTKVEAEKDAFQTVRNLIQ